MLRGVQSLHWHRVSVASGKGEESKCTINGMIAVITIANVLHNKASNDNKYSNNSNDDNDIEDYIAYNSSTNNIEVDNKNKMATSMK